MRVMKDSGVEWIGEIPFDWQVSKIKHVAECDPTCNTEELSDESIVTYTPMEYIKEGFFIPNTAQYGMLSTSLTTYQNGDVVMAKVTPCFENGNIAIMNNLSSGVGLGSSELFVLRSKAIDARYLFYWLRNKAFIQRACSTMTGVGGLKRVSPYFLKNCEIHLPPNDIQHRIAAYLDEKCARIDAVIERQRQIIEKLKAYKLSVITEAVTKGLNPDVPMKDSGVEWIGEIPEHWNVVKLGMLFEFLGGYAFDSDEYVAESGNQLIRIGNVKNDKLILEVNPVYISDELANGVEKFRIEHGCILFTMTGTKGKRDYFYTHLVKKKDVCEKRLYLNQRVGCLIPKEGICAGYYNYLLKEKRILDSIFLYETGTANQGNLGIESIRRTILHLPPKAEQEHIYAHLLKRCSKIDMLIENKQGIIGKLTEYKKSLIYEVVTGKREV